MVDVRVKTLEWWVSDTGDRIADTIIGRYQIQNVTANKNCRLFGPLHEIKNGLEYWPEQEARAAAQADYERRILSTLSDAVAEREAEPVASVAEVRADGKRLYNTVYPSDALDKFPIGTLLYTSPSTSELEALRKRVAELEGAEDEAYRIIGKLEAYAIKDVMYDGRDVAAWCARYAARRVREGGKVE